MSADSKLIQRRAFLKTSAMLVLAVTAPVVSACKPDSKDDVTPDGTCNTTADILGPFYKSGSPRKEHIIPAGNDTAPLIIKGNVYSNCDKFLSNAVVEIWNADEDGTYDLSENFLFRGSYETASDGVYKFRTIIPGRYLNGSTYRPSHLHLRITAPGHRELISQVYFANDPFIDDDPWASDPDAEERILTVVKDDDNIDTVTFDIHMRTTD
jgi:catechol 1,2-dioxygenase